MGDEIIVDSYGDSFDAAIKDDLKSNGDVGIIVENIYVLFSILMAKTDISKDLVVYQDILSLFNKSHHKSHHNDALLALSKKLNHLQTTFKSLIGYQKVGKSKLIAPIKTALDRLVKTLNDDSRRLGAKVMLNGIWMSLFLFSILQGF